MQFFALFLALLVTVTRILAANFAFNTTLPERIEGRSFEPLSSGALARWPRAPMFGNTSPVRYCYADAYTKSRLEVNFRRAANIWMDALGGGPSYQTGHTLEFLEVGAPGGQALCYTQFDPRTQQGTWNPHVRDDVLAVHLSPGGNHAVVGYIHRRYNSQPGRHAIHLAPLTHPVNIYYYVHELGHVLGLLHEHQRHDRDNHITFRCHKLSSYGPAYWKVRNDARFSHMSDGEIIRKLCEEVAFPREHGCESYNYVKSLGEDNARLRPNQIGPYDIQSVMHYNSIAGANAHPTDPRLCPGNLAECPIVKRSNSHPDGRIIHTNFVPSPLDIAAIKRFYNPNIPPIPDNEV